MPRGSHSKWHHDKCLPSPSFSSSTHYCHRILTMYVLLSLSHCRRNDRLFGQRVLFASNLRWAHYVPRLQRPGGSSAAETATLRDRLLLPARQVPDRGELGAVVRPLGRVQRKVSDSFRNLCYFDSFIVIFPLTQKLGNGHCLHLNDISSGWYI